MYVKTDKVIHTKINNKGVNTMLDIYNSFSDFTVFYVAATAIVVLGIIFNNELCYMEDKLIEKLKAKTTKTKQGKRVK